MLQERASIDLFYGRLITGAHPRLCDTQFSRGRLQELRPTSEHDDVIRTRSTKRPATVAVDDLRRPEPHP